MLPEKTTDADWISKNIIALAALMLGVFNLVHQFYIGRRDRENLVTTSSVAPMPAITEDSLGLKDTMELKPCLLISATNSGRRPIILRSLTMVYDGGQRGSPLDGIKGIRLNEKERYLIKSLEFPGMMFEKDIEGAPITMYFTDTLGKKYYIKDAQKSLQQLYPKSKS